MEASEEKALWRIAKKRAAFKRGLLVYLLVNAFLWGIYLFNMKEDSYPWPLWVMFGWGIGLAFAYANAYHNNALFSAEKEYEKLKNNQQFKS